MQADGAPVVALLRNTPRKLRVADQPGATPAHPQRKDMNKHPAFSRRDAELLRATLLSGRGDFSQVEWYVSACQRIRSDDRLTRADADGLVDSILSARSTLWGVDLAKAIDGLLMLRTAAPATLWERIVSRTRRLLVGVPSTR